MIKRLYLLLPFLLFSHLVSAQTIGLFMKDSLAFEGYTMFHSMAYTNTYLNYGAIPDCMLM